MEAARTTRQEGHWDELATALQSCRTRIGSPSYAEIADRIAKARQDQGMDEHVARVARSTVYEAFKVGRVRINLPLSREIAHALGASEEQVQEWITLCNKPTATLAEGFTESAANVAREKPAVPAGPWSVALLLVGCIGLNILGRVLVDVLHLPLYLDMVGTAVAALALGPWTGATVAASTNVIGSLTSGLVSLPFGAVNVAGALVWGYGVRRFGWGRSLPRFFTLNLVVAAVCSLIAVPILILVFGGSVGQGQDSITQTFTELGNGLKAAVGLSNIFTSTADKLISGFVALVVVSSLPSSLNCKSRLIGMTRVAAGPPIR